MARMSSSTRSAQFKLYAPSAKKVSLVGDFNKWNTKTLTAKKDSKGNWIVKTALKAGRHEYKFFVDGRWMDDPNCSWRVSNTFGTQNCVIDIK
jgi:1,4-alpha-glucan branching enzyme